MSKPVAVLISDIHFTVSTLDVAYKALTHASGCARNLGVPLILCGDTLDSKAIIRGECAAALIDILSTRKPNETYVLVGNHDLWTEKGADHSLRFLSPYAVIVDSPCYRPELGSYLLPYFNDCEKLSAYLKTVPKGSRLIMHQGVQTAFMGHYVQDKTSLSKEAFADFRCISGHYHRAQDIKCGRPRKGAVGLFSYVGSPYTTSFSEANDGPKGFQVLHDDGLMELVPTNLRSHRVFERTVEEVNNMVERGLEGAFRGDVRTDDLVWLKIKGPTSELAKLNKRELGLKLLGHSNFKLDKLPTDSAQIDAPTAKMSGEEIFDALIEATLESKEHKDYLKKLWRETV